MDLSEAQWRPSWDETWLAVADVIARRSRCTRAQVGAVIVAEDQTVISASYNGPPRHFPTSDSDCSDWCPRAQGLTDPSPTYDDCPSVHAEANAIARADYSRMQGSTIYVSTSCCKGCAKLLANSGIKRLVYRHEPGREYRNPQATADFLRACGIEVDEV
jgi:dCMP deaminase